MQRHQVTLIDDLDGTEDGVATVSYMLNGAYYEIDLSTANQRALSAIMIPYIDHARLATTTPAGPKPRRTAAARRRAADIRAWAKANGHPAGERGRIPVRTVQEYHRTQRS